MVRKIIGVSRTTDVISKAPLDSCRVGVFLSINRNRFYSGQGVWTGEETRTGRQVDGKGKRIKGSRRSQLFCRLNLGTLQPMKPYTRWVR